MKRILQLCVLCIIACPVFAQKKLPAINVETLKGESLSTNALLADSVPTIITFWSTTCKPCMLELDALTESYEEWQKEMKFKIVAVSIDDSRFSSKVKALASSMGWNATILLDKNQDLKRAMNINSIPQLFLLDKSGNIVYTHSGYSTGSELEVYKELKKLDATK